MDDEENPKEEDVEIIAVSTPELAVTKRPSHISHHRPSFFSPQIEELRRRREELRRKSPEVAESDRLLHEITRLERESRAGDRRPSKNLEKAISETSSNDLEKVHSKLRTKFFSRPKIRAYFHRERLYKSITADNEDVATSCLSLFTDLLFVGVLAETGQLAVLGDGGSISLVRFIVQFLPSWRIWCYIRDIVAIYEMNAISQRSLILWVLSLLVGFVTNIDNSSGQTEYMATGFYVCARLSIGLCNLWFAYMFRHFRLYHIWNFLSATIPSLMWIGALWVDYPYNLAVQWASFIFDWFPYYILFAGMSAYGRITNNPKFYGKPLTHFLEYYPAVDIDMRVERTGNFVSMVLGYIVVNLIYQSNAVIGFNSFMGKGALGLILAWCLNWLFFDIDNKNYEHALTRNFFYTMGYNLAMNLIVTGLTLAGAALPQVILSSDCGDASPEYLGDEFAALSRNPLPSWLRWYFTCGFAAGVMASGLLQLLHKPEKIKRKISRKYRLVLRFVVTLTWALLPLAGTNLNSFELLGIVTSTAYLCLLIEVYGQSPVGSKIFVWKNDWETGYEEVRGGERRWIRTIYGCF